MSCDGALGSVQSICPQVIPEGVSHGWWVHAGPKGWEGMGGGEGWEGGGGGGGGGGRDYMVQSDSERDSVVLGTSSHVQFGSAEQQPCHTQDEQCGGVPPSSALCEVLT